MRSLSRGLVIFSLVLLLSVLSLSASASVVIDLPFMPPQQLPVNIPFLENVSFGTASQFVPTEYRHDGWEILDGDLIVEKGQALELKNYTLFVNCSYDGQHKIEVLDGGSLLVENCSIASLDGDDAFLFRVQEGGRLTMKNSSLSDCGFNGPDDSSKGLWLGSDGNVIFSNNISNDHYGIIVDGQGCSIIGNKMSADQCGLLLGPGSTIVEYNTIQYNDRGIDASRAGPLKINGNDIYDNQLYGLLLGGDGPATLTGNDISNNGEGMILLNASSCEASEGRLDGNGGHGLIVEESRAVSLKDLNVTSNAWGLYVNGTNDSSISGVHTSYNAFDGVFLNNSDNIVFTDNNASYNGGYGFNVTGNNTKVALDQQRNGASWNYKGDYNAPAAALSIAQVSLLSLVIAFADKIIYLIDFQKFIVSNVFNGIVNPIREPLFRVLDRTSYRLLRLFGITPQTYHKGHVSKHLGVFYFHLIDGKEIRCAVRSPTPARPSSNEIVVGQIRFFDLLFLDRIMLFRNIMYFAITTGIGIIVYMVQVWAGTYRLPYFLPLALQFLVMFPIGLIVQGNVVGHVERLEYDAKDEASVKMLRDAVFRQKARLLGQHEKRKISDKKFDLGMKTLSESLKAIDHMGIRRNYLLFTAEGYAKAVSGFESYLQKRPGEPLFLAGAAEAHAMLGRALEKDGGDGRAHYLKALDEAQQAYSLDSSRFEVRRALAMSLLVNSRADSARKEIAEALRLNPGDAESYLVKAMMAETGEERQRLYKKAIAINGGLSSFPIGSPRVPLLATASIKR